jgi:hypothetical protein
LVINQKVIIQKGGRKEAETIENIDVPFKKMSIFFKYLPYWEDLTVCHAIDGMHLQKNVFESTMGFLGLTGKVKDGLKSRKDLVDPKIRQELHPQPRPNGKQYLPPASFNLTQHERLAICKCLRGLKVPTGFSSHIRSLVSLKDMTLTGCNSHDCHVMISVFSRLRSELSNQYSLRWSSQGCATFSTSFLRKW